MALPNQHPQVRRTVVAAASRTVPPVVRATEDDVPNVARLVAEAFCPLRAAQWVVPDPARRQAAIAGRVGILVEHALRHGHVDLLADGSAVAVWLHHQWPSAVPPNLNAPLDTECGPFADRFRTMRTWFEAHHPPQPHHHVAVLAVRPERQGTGRGTRLLRAHHQVLDAGGIPSYLEVAGIRGANLCDREGYRLFAEPFGPPGTTLFYPMWRMPGCRALAAQQTSDLAHRSAKTPVTPVRSFAPGRVSHAGHR